MLSSARALDEVNNFDMLLQVVNELNLYFYRINVFDDSRS